MGVVLHFGLQSIPLDGEVFVDELRVAGREVLASLPAAGLMFGVAAWRTGKSPNQPAQSPDHLLAGHEVPAMLPDGGQQVTMSDAQVQLSASLQSIHQQVVVANSASVGLWSISSPLNQK